MEYYLGVDIGTTSVKAVAFSTNGNLLYSQSGFYKMYHPQPDQSEQDPKEVFAAVVDACNKIYELTGNSNPLFISLSSAMHSLMAIDEEGRLLCNCIIWADNRASEIARGLHTSEKAVQYYELTGVPVHAMTPLCKLFWMKEHAPDLYNSAYKFIGIKEYIFFGLTGFYQVDTSVASATGLLNLQNLTWENSILRDLELTHDSFSELKPPGHVEVLKNTGETGLHLQEGIKIIIGGSDGALANLGAGAADGQTMVITIGTSSAARIVTSQVKLDSAMRTFCYHINNNMYVVGGAGNNGAIVLEWLKDNVLETSTPYAALFAKAATIEPGSEGLIVLPYLLGERAPLWNSNAKGTFFGLDINHTNAHMIRACMEGIIYGIYSIAKILLEHRKVQGIYATGGFAQSPLWVQMLADMCNMNVSVTGAVESSALGAVMLGVEALNLPPLPVTGFVTDYVPNAETHEIYKSSFKKFESIVNALQHLWKAEPVQTPEFLPV